MSQFRKWADLLLESKDQCFSDQQVWFSSNKIFTQLKTSANLLIKPNDELIQWSAKCLFKSNDHSAKTMSWSCSWTKCPSKQMIINLNIQWIIFWSKENSADEKDQLRRSCLLRMISQFWCFADDLLVKPNIQLICNSSPFFCFNQNFKRLNWVADLFIELNDQLMFFFVPSVQMISQSFVQTELIIGPWDQLIFCWSNWTTVWAKSFVEPNVQLFWTTFQSFLF